MIVDPTVFAYEGAPEDFETLELGDPLGLSDERVRAVELGQCVREARLRLRIHACARGGMGFEARSHSIAFLAAPDRHLHSRGAAIARGSWPTLSTL